MGTDTDDALHIEGTKRSWLTQLSEHGPAVDTVAKAAAALLVGIYVAGFLVISIYEADFGVVSGEVIRPKVLAAGVAFVALSMLPAAVGFAYFRSPRARSMRGTESGAEFIAITSMSLGWLTTVFVADPLTGRTWFGLSVMQSRGLVLAGLLVFVISLSLRTRFRGSTAIRVIGALLGAALFYFELPGNGSLLLWFLLIGGAAGLYERGKLSLPAHWNDPMWLTVMALTAMNLYASGVHGRLRPEYGGGAPVPIELHLTEAIEPWTDKDITTQLLSETSSGLYAIHVVGKKRQAVFVPRELVRSILYLGFPYALAAPDPK